MKKLIIVMKPQSRKIVVTHPSLAKDSILKKKFIAVMSCFGFSREQRERINRLNVRKQLQRLLNEDNYVI